MYIYERTEKQNEHIRPVLVEMFLVGGIKFSWGGEAAVREYWTPFEIKISMTGVKGVWN